MRFTFAEAMTNPSCYLPIYDVPRYTPDGIQRLEELGVTDVIVGFRSTYERAQDTEPLQTKIDNLNRYAESIIQLA